MSTSAPPAFGDGLADSPLGVLPAREGACEVEVATISKANDQWADCWIVLQIKGRSASLSYRPYAERIGKSSVIDWVVGRLSGVIGSAARCAVVAEPSEHVHIREALQAHRDVAQLITSGSGEIGDLLYVAMTVPGRRFLVLDPAAALLPGWVLERLIRCHVTRANHATLLAGVPCATPPVLIEGAFISDVRAFISRVQGEDILGGAIALRPTLAVLRRAASAVKATASEVRIQHVNVLTAAEESGLGWPFQVRLREPDDIAVLRRVVADDGGMAADLLARWPTSAGTLRTARLAQLRGETLCSRLAVPRSPRILFAQVPSALSGGEQVVRLLAEHLPSHDGSSYECAALLGSAGTFSAGLANAGVEVTVAEHDFSGSLVQHYLYCRRELARIDPSIVHAHGLVGAPFCAAAIERGVPFIQHVHMAMTTGLQQLEDQIGIASEVIAVSTFVKDRITRLGVDANKVHVIRNAVVPLSSPAMSRIEVRRECGVPPHVPLVLMVARYAMNKRHDVAIEAFALARHRLPEAWLVLAGEAFDGDDVVLEKIKRNVNRLGIASSVRFLGFWHDMTSLYSAADILLLPSEDDPLPLTVLEAMSVGLPVVAARSGGTPEMIDDDVSGILVEPGNPRMFAERMEEMLTRHELRRRVQAAALERCAGEFSVSRFISDIVRIYRQAANAPGAPVGQAFPRHDWSQAQPHLSPSQ